MLDRTCAVIVKLFVVMCADIAPGKRLLKVTKKLRINGEDVFEVPVDRAILDHQDFAIAFDDLRLDFAGFFVHQNAVILSAVDNLPANFRHTARAQRIGLPRPA